MLVCLAGTIADAEAVGWMAWTMRHGEADLVYADHDRMLEDWRTGRFHDRPTLYGAHDPFLPASGRELPFMLLCDTALIEQALASGHRCDALLIERLLMLAARPVHLPRLLASRYRLPAPALAAAQRDGEATGLPGFEPRARVDPPAPVAADDPPPGIVVVIPTHNNAAILGTFVQTLIAHARRPDFLRIAIVDHRSDEPESLRLLATLADAGATLVPFDEPFNWSAANNRGARATAEPLLVFANNDMEMVTLGWDDVVRGLLARRDVGVVGARLLYPDGGYQHAGVLFGTARGAPMIHEGLGHPGDDAGPDGRWHATRLASAVTGAFLAVRRSCFERVGEFDERLAIAYNDLDFCLRVREAGRHVVYCGGLTLIHHESQTRGRNVRAADVAWDEVELGLFADRWGAALWADPGYNPQWALDGVPFDGFREPRRGEIAARVRDGWAIARRADDRA